MRRLVRIRVRSRDGLELGEGDEGMGWEWALQFS